MSIDGHFEVRNIKQFEVLDNVMITRQIQRATVSLV